MLPNPQRNRPHAANVEAGMSLAGDTHMVASATPEDADVERCRLCGHRIFCAESRAAGIGRDCRRRLRAALRGADAEVLAAYSSAAAGRGVLP